MIPMKIWFDSLGSRLVKERKWHQSQEIRELRMGSDPDARVIELC
jgi:hypothetical protein